jgi:hypothetical protein
MRVIALTAGGAIALCASACERTEDQSARLGREGAGLIANTHTMALGGVNHGVRVRQAVLVRGSGRIAAVVQLVSTTARAEVGVPVLIDVKSAAGASLYSNDVAGNQASLHELPLLRARKPAWWVDDQVLAAGTAKTVTVQVGNATGGAHGAASSQIELHDLRLGSDVAGPYVTGSAVNHTGAAQRDMPIYAVALRGARVMAAGRALVPSLPPGATQHATVFRIYLVGNPAGARIELTTAPTIQS